jgi:predicted aspartyl protease
MAELPQGCDPLCVPPIPLIIEAELDDPDCATIMVDGTVAGTPYRFVVDTGAVRTQLEADEYTSALVATPGESSPGAFASHCDPVVTVTDVAVGSLRVATLDVTRASSGPQSRNLLGMDVLRRYRCLFRLESAVLDAEAPAHYQAGRDLRMDSRGHVYVDVYWPGVTAQACWDTGAGITIVNRDF